ncbi:PREDICTED: uncharacterized protein LOC106809871 [Priapulus caudatus]|uniref:Uncharacterized protein LOC106809871 n=1 Tax=Priapulus caudatus TaxID=37621 RepID=A0ABM1E8S2_PRICU|nr:PREDICTED: uncharacterized protein LOC106809871 [Priapulus caudatus]
MEIPSANGIGTSTALAKLYSILATTGELDGQVLLKPDTITKMREQVTSGKDVVMGDYVASQFTAGGFFTGCEWVNSDGRPLFGTYDLEGRGCQTTLADREGELAFCYLTNGHKFDPEDHRASDLVTAAYMCTDKLEVEM